MQQTFDIEAARKAGVKDEDIINYLSKTRAFDVNGATKAGATQKDIAEHLAQMPVSSFTNKNIIPKDATLRAVTAEEINKQKNQEINAKLRLPLSIGAGTGIGALGGGPIGASLGMSIVDRLIQHLSGEQIPSSLSTDALQSIQPDINPNQFPGNIPDVGLKVLEDTAGTELGGKTISGVLNRISSGILNPIKEVDTKKGGLQGIVGGVRDKIVDLFQGSKIPSPTGLPSPPLFQQGNTFGPGSVIKDSIRELDPTFSQYFKNSSWMKSIEDIFAPTAKREALINSADLAVKKAEKTVTDITGIKVKLHTAQETLGSEISNTAINNIRKSYEASGRTAEATKLIAENNPETIKVLKSAAGTRSVSTGILDSSGKPIITTVNVPATYQDITVKGRVDLNKTITLLQEFQNDIAKSKIRPDPEDPVVKAMNDLAEGVGLRIENGKVVYNPISFDEAWKTKQVAANMGYGNPIEGITVKDSRFRKLSSAIDQDIEDSVSKWQNGGNQANQLWNTTKSIVNKRNSIFSADFETGASVSDLLRSVNSPMNSINKQIDDPKKLVRMLGSGNQATLKIGPGTPNIYTPTNTRTNTQGYQFMRIINDSFDQGTKQFSKEKLLSSWAEHISSPSGEILWNKKQKDAMSSIVNDIAQVTDNTGNVGPSRYLTLRLATGTAYLGGGLIGASLGHDFNLSGSLSAGTILTGALTLRQFAKLATNPDTARLMQAIIRKEPLQMSTELAGRRIMYVLKNEMLDLVNDKGDTVRGKVDSQGKIINKGDQNK